MIRNSSNIMCPSESPELIITSEKVRDLTSAPRRLPLEIEGNVTHEIVLAIWSAFSPKDTNTAQDLGQEWLDRVREQTGAELTTEIETLGGPWGGNWLALSSLMLSAPHPHDPDRVFGWLDSIDDNRMRRWLIGYHSHDDDQALVEKAAEGDRAAITELLGEYAAEKPELVDHLLWITATEGLPGRYVGCLRRFRTEVFSVFEDEFAGAISRAAAARRAAPARGSAKEVVEEVTSGIDFEIPLGINRVVLIPSVVTRPLSLLDGHRGNLIVYYGVADEFINSDPEAAPSWVVRLYKALSDEKRLRILRRLSEGETSLDELTDMLGLTKSTVHHHIGLLRGAGLIRIRLPSEEGTGKHRVYALREQVLGDAASFLDSYLHTDPEPVNHA
jgi:DNA-binding transcriptional ArsR family regulator